MASHAVIRRKIVKKARRKKYSLFDNFLQAFGRKPPPESASPAARAPLTRDASMRDLTLPLMENLVAFLRVPAPLSEENFDYLLQQLSILKRGLVGSKSSAPDSPVEESPTASVPFMITHEMRRRLIKLGLSPTAISSLTPADAWKMISEAELADE